MKIALIVWDDEKNRHVNRVVEAMGVSFIFEDRIDEEIKIYPKVIESLYDPLRITPHEALRVRAIHGALNIVPVGNNSIIVEIRDE